MHVNTTTALSTSKVLLVPYCKHHVLRYHDWMKDSEIQSATASEPLSLDEEYSMQYSWRHDFDKLTFIICQPISDHDVPSNILAGRFDGSSEMIGDVNMFVSSAEIDDGSYQIGGELEIMVAERGHRRKGSGKAALLTLLRYVLENERKIVTEFLEGTHPHSTELPRLSFYMAKIGKDNQKSVSLFESLGFCKISDYPNYFGEYELRHDDLTLEGIKQLLAVNSVGGYSQIIYVQQ